MAFSLKKFTTALKAKFSTNKTPSSSHRFGLFLSDGTPDGNATPVDVAQLLGVSKFIIGWQGTPLQSSVFAFTFGTTDGSSIILDIQLYDVNGASSYITISHTKWNTDSWIGFGKHDLLTAKKKGNVMYISQSGGGGYGFVKFRYQGDMSVSLEKVSEIPSDATDVAFQ